MTTKPRLCEHPRTSTLTKALGRLPSDDELKIDWQWCRVCGAIRLGGDELWRVPVWGCGVEDTTHIDRVRAMADEPWDLVCERAMVTLVELLGLDRLQVLIHMREWCRRQTSPPLVRGWRLAFEQEIAALDAASRCVCGADGCENRFPRPAPWHACRDELCAIHKQRKL